MSDNFQSHDKTSSGEQKGLKKSKSGWGQGIIILILLLGTFYYVFNNNDEKRDESTNYGGINSTDKYTLLDIKYREALVINLEPNHSAKVDLTNDYCPLWSSSQVNVYDNNGYLRILEGEKYVKGVSAENSLVYTFTNKSKKNVIVKVWRYVDENDYILHHKH